MARWLRKLARLIDYLERPRLVAARIRGVHVGFFEDLLDLRDSFGLSPATIVDVGANRGDFAAASRYLYPEARIIAFEPNPGTVRGLRERFAADAKVTTFDYALSAENGTSDFYSAADDRLSSLLKPTDGLASFGGVSTSTIEVQCKRFGDVVDLSTHPHPILMKIDVQGNELNVLKGAGEQLRHVDCIKAEYSFDQFYDGQTELTRLVVYCAERGFHRFQQRDVIIADGRIRWCDLVFFRDAG